MRVVVLFEPDEACVDPGDSAKTPRRHYEIIADDVVVVWREYGEQFEGGSRTHYVADGVFSSVAARKLMRALDRL